MCKIKDCERHVFDRGLCLPHLKAVVFAADVDAAVASIEATEARMPKRRRKKIDAVEVVTADSEPQETRQEVE